MTCRQLRLALALALGLAVAAPPAQAGLTTFGYGNARLGSDPVAVGISPQNSSSLGTAWRANAGDAVNGQPTMADGVRVGGQIRDLVLVGTEHGTVVALDADTGAPIWRRQLGYRTIPNVQGCEVSPDNQWGITGTLVVDQTADRVYAVDGNGRAWALALGTGQLLSGWPVPAAPPPAYVWGALALSRGWLYVPVSSICDAGHYYGGITAIDVKRPRHRLHWHATNHAGTFAGGIWGWGGVSVDDANGDVYAATGNSLGVGGEAVGDSESVVRLTAGLAVKQANDPLRGPFPISDRDFGTTPVLVHAPGCPAQLVAINKDGELFLYDRDRINRGPRQRLRVADDSPAFISLYGIPAYEPSTRTLVLVSPSRPPGSRLRAGVQAFSLTRGCRLVLRWQQRFDHPQAGSAPTIAGGVVFIGAGRDGFVRGFQLADGHPVFSRRLSLSPILAAPTVVGDTMFIAGWDGNVWALRPGLRGP